MRVSLGQHGRLVAGAALSPTDAWAIASIVIETTGPDGDVIARERRILVRWDGSSWAVDEAVAPSGVREIAGGASGIWLTGGKDSPALQRWDGFGWTSVEPPSDIRFHGTPYVTTMSALDDGVVTVGTASDGTERVVRYTCAIGAP